MPPHSKHLVAPFSNLVQLLMISLCSLADRNCIMAFEGKLDEELSNVFQLIIMGADRPKHIQDTHVKDIWENELN